MASSDNKTKNTTAQEDVLENHPLLQYDPEAVKWIGVIKAEYFEAESTKPPVPRNQDLPAHAFGELTGRTILAATSHAWFWQSHPDPEGVKLKLLRDDFIPRLRKRYPETNIVFEGIREHVRTVISRSGSFASRNNTTSQYTYMEFMWSIAL